LAEVARGESGKDISTKPLAAKVGQIPRVIDVRVGEHYGVNARGIKERKAAIHLIRISAMTLIEATIEQNALAIHIEQMLGSCGRSRGSAKSDFHTSYLLSRCDADKGQMQTIHAIIGMWQRFHVRSPNAVNQLRGREKC
jgi:hypothetical protein